MKVMFVVQGEGRGHLTQALTLERMLRENGHEVVRILVGKSRTRQLPNFFLRKAKAPVETFQSLNFIPSANNCHIAHVRTAFYNLLRTPKYLYGIRKIYRSIQESGADIVVNFYYCCPLKLKMAKTSNSKPCKFRLRAYSFKK